MGTQHPKFAKSLRQRTRTLRQKKRKVAPPPPAPESSGENEGPKHGDCSFCKRVFPVHMLKRFPVKREEPPIGCPLCVAVVKNFILDHPEQDVPLGLEDLALWQDARALYPRDVSNDLTFEKLNSLWESGKCRTW